MSSQSKSNSLRSLVILLAASSTEACRSPAIPHDQAPASAQAAKVDYASRRIGGRTTIRLSENVTVHADRQEAGHQGLIRLTGNVFVDGHRSQSSANDWPGGFPWYGYAEVAIWNPSFQTLTLYGSPVVERKHLTIQGHTKLVLDREGSQGGNRMTLSKKPNF